VDVALAGGSSPKRRRRSPRDRAADINGDGGVDFGDINPLVSLLSG
jgi:hypothetical protein